MDNYYITYIDKAKQSGKYPTDITLGVLDNFEIAEKYILNCFSERLQQYFGNDLENENGDFLVDIHPILITNDPSLYLLYKGVFQPHDFKYFCRVYEHYQALQPYEKRKVEKGRGTLEAYCFFEKLVKKEGKCAYQFIKTEQWHDESGNSRYAEVDSDWVITNNYYVNQDIKIRYGL